MHILHSLDVSSSAGKFSSGQKINFWNFRPDSWTSLGWFERSARYIVTCHARSSGCWLCSIVYGQNAVPFYAVSQKNIPNIFSRNSRKHCRIFIIFGPCVTEELSNQQMLQFPTTPN